MKSEGNLLKLSPKTKAAPLVNVGLIVFCSFFIALAAQVSALLSLMLFSLQNSAGILTTALLGSKRSFLCASCYLLEGALGAKDLPGDGLVKLHFSKEKGYF